MGMVPVAAHNHIGCHHEATADERARAEGVITHDSPREASAPCDMVIMFVPGSAEAQNVVLGDDGMGAGLRPGGIIANMSTGDFGVNMRLAEFVKGKGVIRMDTPVLGGPESVGHWAFAVGGNKDDFECSMPVLEVLDGARDRVFHVGQLSNGNKLKLLNNMMLGAINACAAETMALVACMGISRKTLTDVAVAAEGRILSDVYLEIGNRIAESRADKPTLSLKMLAKENRLYLNMAREYKAPLVLGTAVDHINRMSVAQGLGNEDHTCVWKSIQRNWKK